MVGEFKFQIQISLVIKQTERYEDKKCPISDIAGNFEEFLDEDECCLECGEIAYTQSKILGVCMDCASNFTARDSNSSDKLFDRAII